MPNYLRPPQGGILPARDAAYEAMLAGSLPPAEAPAELRPLAEAIAALSLAPAGHELAGEPTARAAYRAGFGRAARCGRTHRAHRAHRPRSRVVGLIRSAKLAVAAAVAAGVLTSAAYADVLPAPLQSLVHRALGAPSPHPALPRQRETPARLAPAAPDAHGLCNAWAHAEAYGQAREEAVAFRTLAAAAGGPGRVTAYCAAPHPGTPPPGQRGSHPKGKPSTSSSPTAAGHATGKPTSHPSQPDHPGHTSHPAHPSHPAAKPTSHP
jgi:hypothetical protein